LAIENDHRNSGFTHEKWGFAIVFFLGLKFSLLMFKPFYGLYVVSVDVDLG
jgi:hypothetical protein